MSNEIIIFGIVIIAVPLMMGLFLWIYCYKTPAPEQAFIITTLKTTKVFFNKIMIIPVLHRLDVVDLSVKSFTLERKEDDTIFSHDRKRVAIKITFFIKINDKEEDIKNIAQMIGTTRAANSETIRQLFEAKFLQALKTVVQALDFTQLYSHRDKFKEILLQEIGIDLHGYLIETLTIDYLEER